MLLRLRALLIFMISNKEKYVCVRGNSGLLFNRYRDSVWDETVVTVNVSNATEPIHFK